MSKESLTECCNCNFENPKLKGKSKELGNKFFAKESSVERVDQETNA
ncbi:MAG: hypothetical protein ACYCQJ_04040 [Nitrososphaerales archaeon]